MNLVRIRGSAEVIRGLRAIAGLHVEIESVQREGEEWTIAAYGSDEALEAVRTLGLAVDVIMDNERLAAHEATVRSQIRDVPRAAAAKPPPGGTMPAGEKGE